MIDFNQYSPCSEHKFGDRYFRITNVNVTQEPQQFEIADPYSIYPRYVNGYGHCEATIECSDIQTLQYIIKYLESYNENSDCSKSIDSIKHDYEEQIECLKEKYNTLLEEVMKTKVKPKYKLKHRIKYIKL